MNEQFRDFLRDGIERGGFESDDVLGALLPLLEQVAMLHERGRVAALDHLAGIVVDDGRLRLADRRGQPPRRNERRLRKLQKPQSRALEVVGRASLTLDVALGEGELRSTAVADVGDELTEPAYLPGYTTWEHSVGHHDELTDVLSLGLVLASLACGLDLTERDDLETFAQSRADLFRLNERLHPVIARVIREMTELDRSRRAQDLAALIGRLETYRDQPLDLDLAHVPGLAEASGDRPPDADPRAPARPPVRDLATQPADLLPADAVLAEPHGRVGAAAARPAQHQARSAVDAGSRTLADEDRRRRQRSTSAPTCGSRTPRTCRVCSTSSSRRRVATAPSSASRSYGSSSVSCAGTNLKEATDERIASPLLLLPVELAKKRGVRDTYVLTATTSEAEVNPALRHHLKAVLRPVAAGDDRPRRD